MIRCVVSIWIVIVKNCIQIKIDKKICLFIHTIFDVCFFSAVFFVRRHRRRLLFVLGSIRAIKSVSLFCALLIKTQNNGSIILRILCEAMNMNVCEESATWISIQKPSHFAAMIWLGKTENIWQCQCQWCTTYCFNGFRNNRSKCPVCFIRTSSIWSVSIKQESLIWLLEQINLDSQI